MAVKGLTTWSEFACPANQHPKTTIKKKGHKPFLTYSGVQWAADVHSHGIGLSDLTDLWVIKMKKPMILCARRSTSRSREQSMEYRSSSENMRTFCLGYTHKNNIAWSPNFWGKWRCAKVCGLVFLTVLFGYWLAEPITWMAINVKQHGGNDITRKRGTV